MSQKHSPAQFNNFVQPILTGYNLDVLPRLTEDDLKDLGLQIGDRRRLQGTIDAWLPKDPPTGAGKAPRQDREYQPAEAERRQVTVMFSTLLARHNLPGTWIPRICRKMGIAESTFYRRLVLHRLKDAADMDIGDNVDDQANNPRQKGDCHNRRALLFGKAHRYGPFGRTA